MINYISSRCIFKTEVHWQLITCWSVVTVCGGQRYSKNSQLLHYRFQTGTASRTAFFLRTNWIFIDATDGRTDDLTAWNDLDMRRGHWIAIFRWMDGKRIRVCLANCHQTKIMWAKYEEIAYCSALDAQQLAFVQASLFICGRTATCDLYILRLTN